jgi:hypothetical protein
MTVASGDFTDCNNLPASGMQPRPLVLLRPLQRWKQSDRRYHRTVGLLGSRCQLLHHWIADHWEPLYKW